MRGLSCTLAVASIALSACGRNGHPPAAEWISLAAAETAFGPLITAGNHPTPNQNGTGERVGIFRDVNGTVWGLPLSFPQGGAILVCAPAELRDARVTDTFPAGFTIIGATNEPTGWREGTGNLELLFREPDGAIRRQAVGGSQLANGPVCRAPDFPGPPQQLDYYRLIPRAHD
jgi:hypothetical protein